MSHQMRFAAASFLGILCCSIAAGQSGTIRTVAGGGPATGDGAATSASLNQPSGVAVDPYGSFYIADTSNCKVKKVSQTGIITTVAGAGSAACSTGGSGNLLSGDGGPATSASLNNPTGVAVDLAGNVYIADSINNRIRKVDGSGMITTIAGSGRSGPGTGGFSGDGGAATAAVLNDPQGVAVDLAGNVYIADTGNDRVRKVSVVGTITTVAGGGTGGDGGAATAALLSSPTGVAVDGSGNVYIADAGENRVRKVSSNGTISTVAGVGGPDGFSGDGGPATSARLNGPLDVAVDAAGAVYIADEVNNRIRRVVGGTITTVAGNGAICCGTLGSFSGDGGPATSAGLYGPAGVAVDSSGNLFIADTGNNRIREVIAPAPITTLAITSLSPTSASAGGPAFTLTLYGSGFVSGSAVQWNGTSLSTTYLASTQLTASVSASMIASAGSASVTVLNPGGIQSGSFVFPVNASAPAVGITSISPSSAAAGGKDFILTVNGTGFVSGASVQWNGSPVPTTFVSSTQLTATISASLIATAGSAGVTVANPGGAASSSSTFQITAVTSAPVISGLTPTLVTAGSKAFTLTVNGSGFVSGASVQWNGSALPTTFVSASQLTASVSAPLVATAGSANVVVSLPGGAVSGSAGFVISPFISGATGVLPHFAANGVYVTGIYVVNTGAASAQFAITFYSDGGQPIFLPVSGIGTVNQIFGTLPAYGSAYYEVGDPASALVGGAAQISADPAISIQGLFRLRQQSAQGTANYYEAAVASTAGSKEFEISFDATTFAPTGEQLYTGIAIANLDSAKSSTVTCTARDSQGKTIPNAVSVPALVPSGHWAGFDFPALLGQRGTLDCTATTTIGAIALHAYATSGAISTISVITK